MNKKIKFNQNIKPINPNNEIFGIIMLFSCMDILLLFGYFGIFENHY